MIKTYSTKTNARRAAKAQGLDLDTLDFHQNRRGGWGWTAPEAKKAPEPQPDPEHVAEPEADNFAPPAFLVHEAAPAATETPAVEPAHEPAPKAKPAAPRPAAAPKGAVATMLDLLKRPEGASVAEIVAETGWQPHTTRARISVTVARIMGLAVARTKVEGRGSVYRVAA